MPIYLMVLFIRGVSFPANGLVFSQKRNQHSVKGAPSYNAWPTFWRDQIRNLRPASILATGCFLYVLKLCDLDGTFRELGGDFEFSAHGFDEILKRAHVHIRASLELGYGGLVDSENFGKMHLCHVAGLTEFVQSHAGAIFGRQKAGTLLSPGRHFCAERIE